MGGATPYGVTSNRKITSYEITTNVRDFAEWAADPSAGRDRIPLDPLPGGVAAGRGGSFPCGIFPKGGHDEA